MKDFVKDFFTKRLELNFINILMIALLVYVYNLSGNKYFSVYLFFFRFIALCIDYLTDYLKN
ncbi:hypothetical protein [Tissierella praeacuta]|uniref:hypothetical protein n=1 Tax=Tissierella praeacuta TaxID=43131 RepID=UPI00289AC563|nr:hypothetical protein [Tissierella praeacuta]